MKKITMNKITIITLITLTLIFIFLLGILVGKKYIVKNINKNQNYQVKTKNINLINREENIVFLGDSITEIYPIDEMYGNLPIVKSGVSGYTTNDVLEKMNKMVYQYNPTKVFILIGTNDFREECNEETMNKVINNINNIVTKIKKNRKNTKIYIESIYPVNDEMDEDMVAERDNKVIIETNNLLKKYCKKNKIEYINLYDELTDENGNFNEKYTYDGLHPNTMGYGRITRILLPYIYDGYSY